MELRGLPPRRSVRAYDVLDVSLDDADLLEEVGLSADLMIAAAHSDEPLTQDQIDQLLGL